MSSDTTEQQNQTLNKNKVDQEEDEKTMQEEKSNDEVTKSPILTSPSHTNNEQQPPTTPNESSLDSQNIGSDPEVEKLLKMYKEALEERERLYSIHLQQQRKLTNYFHSTKKQLSVDFQEKSTADNQERYNKYIAEHRELRLELEALQAKNEQQLTEMRNRLNEKQSNAMELQASFRSYKTAQALQGESTRTGKLIPKKEIVEFERLEKELDEQIREVRTRYILLKNQKENLDSQISEKEEFSKGLHLIDFEQHKIENANLNEKLEEKNESLQKSRIKATQTVHILTHVKEKLQFVQSENAELQRVLGELEQELAEHKDILTQLKREREILKNENIKMKDKMPLVGNDKLLVDYESRKKEVEELKQTVAELKSKHKQLVSKIQMYNSLIHAHQKNSKRRQQQERTALPAIGRN